MDGPDRDTTIRLTPLDGALRVEVLGVLDVDTAVDLGEVLEELAVTWSPVVIDLHEATTAPLAYVVLARCRDKVARTGVEVQLQPDPEERNRHLWERGIAALWERDDPPTAEDA
jgi:hypothetical protein